MPPEQLRIHPEGMPELTVARVFSTIFYEIAQLLTIIDLSPTRGPHSRSSTGTSPIRMTTIIYIYKCKYSPAVRSEILSKLIFASCVWYSDRAYYGLCVLIKDVGRRLPLQLHCSYLGNFMYVPGGNDASHCCCSGRGESSMLPLLLLLWEYI